MVSPTRIKPIDNEKKCGLIEPVMHSHLSVPSCCGECRGNDGGNGARVLRFCYFLYATLKEKAVEPLTNKAIG